jgi:sugar-specific transcriptional regulator TrmB
MIEEKLKSLGLSDNEIKVYLCVLENTKITPTMVARKTGVSRPTAYGVGKSLAEKGFIEMDELSPTLYFIALPPENVARVVRQEKLEIEDKIKTAESLIGELALVPRSKNYSIPKVRFIDENNFEDFLYKQSPIWNQSGIKGDATWWGFQDHDFVEQYPEWFKWYFGFSAGKIKSKLITNVEEKDKMGEVIHRDYERAAKYWGGGDKIKITHAVLGDYILIANTQTKPHYVVEIHDAVIADNLREIFKGFWEMLS